MRYGYIKNALVISFLSVLAVFLHAYLAFSEYCVLPLTTFMVAYTFRESTPRRTLTTIFCILVSAVVIIVLRQMQTPTWIILTVLLAIFSLTYLLIFINRPLTQFNFINIIILPVLLSIFFAADASVQIRPVLIDILLGSIIGLAGSMLLLPVNLNNKFRVDITPQIVALINYAKHFTQKDFNINKPAHGRLLTKARHYPEWVFVPGFNPGLRSGLRFFLIRMERLIDLFTIINFLLCELNQAELTEIRGPFTNAMEINLNLLRSLRDYFRHNKISPIDTDLTTDIVALEDRYKPPPDTQILSDQQIRLLDLVRNLRDLRETLLIMIQALPKANG